MNFFNSVDEEEEGSGFFWTISEPFFKKYNLVFNQDTKRIDLFTQQNFNNNVDNQENKSFLARNKWDFILAIGFVLVCSGLGFMI